MNSGIIIFSSDSLFVSYVSMHYREEYYLQFIDRVIDSEELINLLNVFIKEKINFIQLICDSKLSLNEYNEIEEIIKEYQNQLEIKLLRGIDEYYESQEI